MDRDTCWQLFWETGAPELYLLCRSAQEDTTCKQEKS